MSHMDGKSDDAYEEGQPTKAYNSRDFDAGEAQTDEIEIPQQSDDRTRVMPVSGQADRRDASWADAQTKRFTPTPGYEDVGAAPRRTFSDSAPTDHDSSESGAFQSAPYRPEASAPFAQPQPISPVHEVRQPAYVPRPADLRKGPSAAARLGSLVINLLLTIGMVVVLWDYTGAPNVDSVILNWFVGLDLSSLLYSSIIPIGVGLFALISGLSLSLSGTGAGMFGLLVLLFCAVSVLIPGVENSGAFGAFVGGALPFLFPLSLVMIGAGIGAHFARRAGAKKIIRAYSGRV